MLIRPQFKTKVFNGLVGWWPFDDGSINDFSGRPAVNLAQTGGTRKPSGGIAWPANGKVRGGWQFNGSSDYLTVNNASLSTAERSYAIWVYPTSLAAAYAGIIGGCLTSNNFLNLFVKSNGKLACYAGQGGSVSYDGTGTNTLAVNRWYHLAMTYSSLTDTIKGYVNGQLDGTGTGVLSDIGNNHITTLGNDSTNASRFFTGILDDARVYSRVLQAWEVKEIASEPFRPFDIENIALMKTGVAAAGFKAAWSRQSNLPVIGGGTF